MKSKISGVRVTSVVSVVPSIVHRFEDDMKNFPFSESSSLKLAKVMGFREHRIADKDTTLIDLAVYGADYLFKKGIISKDALSAVIFVAQNHEYPVPGNSKIFHSKLSLPKNVHCVDMYENCTGFVSGLYTAACMLASSDDIKNIMLVTSSSGACYANKTDRNTYPLVGDAAGIVIVSKAENKDDSIYFEFCHDTDQCNTLIVPAGGLRCPCSEETAKMETDEMGNTRSKNQLHMDGTAVFHYVMEAMPPLLEDLCAYSDVSKENIDYFLTHQPNRFMLEKLADLLKVPREKVFNNVVENFGNSSCATIPVAIALNMKDMILSKQYKTCFAAFGAGMSVGAAITDFGKLNCCALIEHPCSGSNEYKE